MTKFLKILLLIIVLFVLSVSAIQQQFKIFPENFPLYGSFNTAKDTTLTFENWFSREYQDKKEGYLNETFGFRNFLVKLNNQIDFSVYEYINVGDVFKGKNNYLYSRKFFNNYAGRTYRGNGRVDSVFNDLKKLNDWLMVRNKKLLVCFTPSKESFYPEFLPDSCLPYIRKENYYSMYRQKLIKSNIPFLDFNAYFQKIKREAPYPLFTQGAVHWTTYGAYLALDTLLRRTSFEINKKINLIAFKSYQLSDTAREADDDISKAMNLLKNVNSQKLAYPVIDYVYNQDSCYKPKALIIGDSFFYGLNNTWIPLSVFSKESYFLYYFQLAISYEPQKKDSKVSDMDFVKELENTDIIILFFTVGNLDNFPYSTARMIIKN